MFGKGYYVTLFFLTVVFSSFSQERGLTFDDEEYNSVPKRFFTVRGPRVLEPTVSLKDHCPKPLNQLDYNTSPGWAASYGAFTILNAYQKNISGPEVTKNAFSPIYPYFLSKHTLDEGCYENVSLFEVLNNLKEKGTPMFMEMPQRCVTSADRNIRTNAWYHKISEYARLFDMSDTKEEKIKAIKTTLAENVPVIAAMHVPKSFEYAKEFWQPREKFSKDLPGQAVCVIGYDDKKFGGAFEIMNSWGSDWGNDGFMWIRYDDFVEFTRYALDIYVIPGRIEGMELGGSVELKLMDEQDMEIDKVEPGYYRIGKSYPTGTMFTIEIRNQSPAFIYAFSSDLTEEIFPIFPPSMTSAAFAKASNFFIPDELTPIEITGESGTDYLCVLFSKEDLDIGYLTYLISKEQGSFKEKIIKTLDTDLVSPEKVAYRDDKISFTLPESNESVVMVIVEHDHR